MSPIQQMLLGVGSVATKTYVDEVFNPFLYEGTDGALTGNSGLDLSGEGGMIWIKNRTDSGRNNILFDTERGVNKVLKSDTAGAETTDTNANQTFTSTGFTLNNDIGNYNQSTKNYCAWNFRKAKGFFDVVTYTGNASTQDISHSLKCKPGLILIKRIGSFSGTYDWVVYHRSLGESQYLKLHNDDAASSSAHFNGEPTDTVFKLDDNWTVNGPNYSYVAYLFAGGASTNALASSVEFDASGDYLVTGSSSDFTMGTGDFTVEGWFKPDAYNNVQLQISDDSSGLKAVSHSCIQLSLSSSGYWVFVAATGEKTTSVRAQIGQWQHIAYVRNNGTTSLYVNGVLAESHSDTFNYNGTYLAVGGGYSTSYLFDGKISNFRVVKGTAVYTSSFRPPTEPLANITNTKLLCCNNSSTTGSTVTPGTITANGNPTASTDSPFDDPAGFVFGENEDQNVVKCGSYVGNGSSDGTPEIDLGFEPQYVLVKRTDASGNWSLADSMRGIATNANDSILHPNNPNGEGSGDMLDLTSTGFKITTNDGDWNTDGGQYIFLCIRRPDGYVGKPIEDATKCFAMDTGAGSSTIPTYDSGFPVDYAFLRTPASSGPWYTSARLIDGQVNYISTAAEHASGNFIFDSNIGWAKSHGSSYQSWMFKRHAGMDCICYKGNGSNTGDTQSIPHGLNQIPEMAWIKKRSASDDWIVYNKDLHSSIPEKYYLVLNDSASRTYQDQIFDIPTSTHFNLRHTSTVNQNNQDFIMILFSSVSGISKVGSYDGSSSGLTITTGFAPRFLILRNITDNSSGWIVLDTTRGWGSGSDYALNLNNNEAQNNFDDIGYPTSTGFYVGTVNSQYNAANKKYIYYAHA